MTSRLDQAEWRLDCLNSRMETLQRADADDPRWEGYEQRGTKEKGGDTVPNCVKADEGLEKFYIVTYDRDGVSKRPKFTKGEATKSGESHLRTSAWKGARYEVINMETGAVVAQGQK